MAVILRSNTDLVYLPDHGFVGEEGALRILPQITRHIHRLDISHNLLGSSGTLTLFKGLSTLCLRHSSAELGLGMWGLKEVNLGNNNLDDIAFDGVLAYAKKDVWLKRVLVHGNDITLDEKNVNSIVNSLNGSHITSLSLVNNTSISPKGLVRLMGLLDATELKQLLLSACNLSSEDGLIEAIVNYLASSRSRNLESLELNGNHLGGIGVTKIVDCIESSNWTITTLGLLANHSLSDQLVPFDDVDPDHDHDPIGDRDHNHPGFGPDSDYRLLRAEESRTMDHQIHRRLPEILDRNRILSKRIRLAALKTLVPARIILNAIPLSDEQTARRIIYDISQDRSCDIGGFRLLELPEEVIHLIVRHTSDDPWAFSESQWTRLRKEVSSRDNLRKASELANSRLRGKLPDERRETMRELKNDWLRKGRWDKWER
ncbi:hypothetical protein I204_04530 [Kwoniella mangroviensis CBS 8886]|uniref:uncharacterized protein n=1 Tax=Kwoniella mangroviensis CBS 8507 TaxID=1296122 RepID=UPI00080CC8D6|nr:uncharacterized protein I203_04268 [Kwoniella mangroviensis CBS 8507]OCF66692.1 hypothetical protein I203_04268 [Kwoniella mangroviensis CBS 8507]OCF74160.1 hypothetical protein I204_04530 [Kwoniella mangroviensis CBS 8886]